jgi:hypothetical protein
MHFNDLIIIETGGMKGTRKEITKAALHSIITAAFRYRQMCILNME